MYIQNVIKANLLRYRRLERNFMYIYEIHVFSNLEHSRETTISIFSNSDLIVVINAKSQIIQTKDYI